MSLQENRKIMISKYLKETDINKLEIISNCIDNDDFETFCALYQHSKKDVMITIAALIEDNLI